jgi:hypothetical protein
MVLVRKTQLETFPICCKKYSPICYLRQTNRYVPRKLPDVHGMAANVALALAGGSISAMLGVL